MYLPQDKNGLSASNRARKMEGWQIEKADPHDTSQSVPSDWSTSSDWLVRGTESEEFVPQQQVAQVASSHVWSFELIRTRKKVLTNTVCSAQCLTVCPWQRKHRQKEAACRTFLSSWSTCSLSVACQSSPRSWKAGQFQATLIWQPTLLLVQMHGLGHGTHLKQEQAVIFRTQHYFVYYCLMPGNLTFQRHPSAGSRQLCTCDNHQLAFRCSRQEKQFRWESMYLILRWLWSLFCFVLINEFLVYLKFGTWS